MNKSIRITPTKHEGSFFINELIKKNGKWVNKPGNVRATPVYINEETTVFELMKILEDKP